MNTTKKRLFIGTAILAISAFLLNWWGFAILRQYDMWGMGNAPWGEEIHQSLRLFLRGSDFRDLGNHIPLQLTLGRLLSLGTIFLSTVLIGYLIFRQSWRELRLRGFWKIHTHPSALIINLPDEYRSLIPELAELHQNNRSRFGTKEPVVVVLPDRSSPFAKECERAGLWVVDASKFDGDDTFFRRTGAHQAQETYIFGEDSAANLDLALRCQTRFSDIHKPPSIHVQLEDPDLRYALQNRKLTKNVPVGKDCANSSNNLVTSAILPFSTAVNAARLTFADASVFSIPIADSSRFISRTNLKDPHHCNPIQILDEVDFLIFHAVLPQKLSRGIGTSGVWLHSFTASSVQES